MAILKHIETIQSNINTITVVPGQLIYCTDTLQTFYDNSIGDRIQLGDILYVNTDAEREALLAPITNKLYIVRSTGNMYIYDGNDWITVSSNIEITSLLVPHIELVPTTLTKNGVSYAPRTLSSCIYHVDGAKLSDQLTTFTNHMTTAGTTTLGHVKNGGNININVSGEMNAPTASTTVAGIVQLNDNINSTLTTQAATANAVKKAYDQAITEGVQKWNASIKCATWSRVAYLSGASTSLGNTIIVTLRATRSSVAYNVTLLITSSYPSICNIVQLGNTSYSNIQIRGIVNSTGDVYIEIYDNANNATNATTQTVEISLINISKATLLKYTAFTDGTTIPANFAEKGKITTVSGNTLVANLSGSATSLAVARKIELDGDVTGSVNFDGASDVTITATVVDGSHNHISADITDATNANTANMIVKRDESGNFSAGTITATLSGNASTVTKLQTARKINGVDFDGSKDITIMAAPTAHGHLATEITTDANNRFVSDTEKSSYADKYTKSEIDNKFSTLSTGLDWKEAVATFDDLATTYSTPEDGWTVNVKDTDYTYRYNGSAWIAISANAIPKATTALDGLMSKEDKTKLNGIADNANNYSHPGGDGNLHVPVTGTTNNGKVLKAGSTAGSLSWGTLTYTDVGAAAASHNHTKSQITDFPTSLPASGGNSDTVDTWHVDDTKSGVDATTNNALWTANKIKGLLDGKANTSHGNHVPAVQAADNLKFLRNDNSWYTIQTATTSVKGVTQLSNTVMDGSTDKAATPNMVTQVMDYLLDSHLVYTVRATTTGNITLSGMQNIDGVALDYNDRVLVKNQTNPVENGIYISNPSGAWTRATDYDGPEITVSKVRVTEGTISGNTIWGSYTTEVVTIGTTSIYYVLLGLIGMSGAASSLINTNLTPSRALVSSASGKIEISTVTATELGYLSQVTSPIQTQLNTKASKDVATDAINGLMSKEDKTKLNGIADNANNYSHPGGDGNLHVPVTGTTNNGKVLKAGSTAGSLSWGTLSVNDLSDTTIGTLANNNILQYNGTKWVNRTLTEAGIAAASHGNHVPATQTADNAKFLRNDNTWAIVTPANIGAAPGGFGLGGVCKTVTVDWNNYMDTGFYMGQSITNECPAIIGTSSWKYCIIMKHNNLWCIQIMWDFNNTVMYTRSSIDNGAGGVKWEPWRRIDNPLKVGTTSTDAAAGDHRHDNATQSADGFMSKEDKIKLDTNNADTVDTWHVNDTKTGVDATTNNALWTANKIRSYTNQYRVSKVMCTLDTQDANNNKWYKLCTITLSKQYDDYNIIALVNDGNHGSAFTRSGLITFRAKQQAAMGSDPSSTIYLSNYIALDPAWFKAVVTSKTASNTIITLYYYNPGTYTKMTFDVQTESQTGTPSFTLHTPEAGVTTLPAGTVIDCTVNGNVLSATKLTTARLISFIGDVTGSGSFDGSANIDITATVVDDSHNHSTATITNLKADLVGQNADNITISGFYACTSNIPSGLSMANVLHIKDATASSTKATQIASDPATNRTWTRTKNTTTWSAWLELFTFNGGTLAGSLTANILYVKPDATDTFNHRVSLYDPGDTSAQYGLMLWNDNGTAGSWSTMLYGPNQPDRKISFGKINTTTRPTKHADITEGAFFNLNDWSLNLTNDVILKNSIYGMRINALTGTWARGVVYRNAADTAIIGGMGMYGSNDTTSNFYMGFGSSPWTNPAFQVSKTETVTSNNIVIIKNQPILDFRNDSGNTISKFRVNNTGAVVISSVGEDKALYLRPNGDVSNVNELAITDANGLKYNGNEVLTTVTAYTKTQIHNMFDNIVGNYLRGGFTVTPHTSALTLNIAAGTAYVLGVRYSLTATTTKTITAAVVNYVYINASGVITVSTTAPGTDCATLATIAATAAGTVVAAGSITDTRNIISNSNGKYTYDLYNEVDTYVQTISSRGPGHGLLVKNTGNTDAFTVYDSDINKTMFKVDGSGNTKLLNGADLIISSDGGTTTKFSVDGDTGDVNTSGKVAANSMNIASKFEIQYNSNMNSLDFVFVG